MIDDVTMIIEKLETRDHRFELEGEAGSDAVHKNPLYSYATTVLKTETGLEGVGWAFTLGEGNDLVCRAIEVLGQTLVGQDLESLMADFGTFTHHLENHPQFRWLGPHKGLVHLALASLVNACFDLWARSREVPLWKLLLDLSDDQVLALLDFSYLEDCLTPAEAGLLLAEARKTRSERTGILEAGYPGYDTSIGWFGYSDGQIRDNIQKAVDAGFTSLKLKVGSPDPAHDLRRAHLVREAAGSEAEVMLDANQQWSLPRALEMGKQLAEMNPYWIEEPTHPDDILGHQTLVKELAPVKIAAGEHVPNRIVFKNYLQVSALHFVQADCTRLAGISEFLVVSLLAIKYGKPVVPHVGDMGQVHQHLVLFNHIALGHEALLLEHIPHLQRYFTEPARVEGGRYRTPEEPGSSTRFLNR